MVARHDGLDAREDKGNVFWIKANLRIPSEAVEGAEKAVQWAGGTIDILVNNAGIVAMEEFMGISSDAFDEVIAVNTRAPLLVSQVCGLEEVPQCFVGCGIHLRRREWGAQI